MLDNDGYPTEDDLTKIATWSLKTYNDFEEFLSFCKSLWLWQDYFTKDVNGEINVSTGGWSGHEDVIGAMQKNTMFWTACWVSSARGGHYIFEMPWYIK